MQAQQRLQFESETHREIYDYVERTGAVEPTDIADRMGMDVDDLREDIADLEDSGYLTERDGTVQVALGEDVEETHETDGLTFTVRTAREGDLTGIIGTIKQVATEGSYIEAETVAETVDKQGVLLRHNEAESRVFFVATVSGDVVGWLHLESPEVEKLSHTAELTLGVLEEYRGHGIGSRLLERGLSWAADNGYERVYQSLPATNQGAIQFLESHGWVTEAIRKYHYKIDDEYVAEQMLAVML